jgi:hypothetical protein
VLVESRRWATDTRQPTVGREAPTPYAGMETSASSCAAAPPVAPPACGFAVPRLHSLASDLRPGDRHWSRGVISADWRSRLSWSQTPGRSVATTREARDVTVASEVDAEEPPLAERNDEVELL